MHFYCQNVKIGYFLNFHGPLDLKSKFWLRIRILHFNERGAHRGVEMSAHLLDEGLGQKK